MITGAFFLFFVFFLSFFLWQGKPPIRELTKEQTRVLWVATAILTVIAIVLPIYIVRHGHPTDPPKVAEPIFLESPNPAMAPPADPIRAQDLR